MQIRESFSDEIKSLSVAKTFGINLYNSWIFFLLYRF